MSDGYRPQTLVIRTETRPPIGPQDFDHMSVKEFVTLGACHPIITRKMPILPLHSATRLEQMIARYDTSTNKRRIIQPG